MNQRDCQIQSTYLWGALRTTLIKHHHELLHQLHQTDMINANMNAEFYIAGSFATHYDLSAPPSDYNAIEQRNTRDQYIPHTIPSRQDIFHYNDIDIFVVNPDNALLADRNERYSVRHSYHLNLYLNNPTQRSCGCIQRHDQSPKLNIIILDNCCDLEHLISFFDINSCQVGYKLDLQRDTIEERTVTNAYRDFVQTRVLKAVVHNHKPVVTYCRILRKHSELNCPMKLTAPQISNVYRSSMFNFQNEVEEPTFTKIMDYLALKNENYFLQDYFDIEFLPADEEDEDGSVSFRLSGPRYKLRFQGCTREPNHFYCLQGQSEPLFKTISTGNWEIAFQKDQLGITPLEYLINSKTPNCFQNYGECFLEILRQHGRNV